MTPVEAAIIAAAVFALGIGYDQVRAWTTRRHR